jgi:hypothetical protein
MQRISRINPTELLFQHRGCSTLYQRYALRLWQLSHLVELSRVAGSHCPITFGFKRLRRSGRQASQTKRSYETYAGRNKRTGKLPKRPKLAADKPATYEPATYEPAADEPAALDSINDPAVIEPNTMEPLETLREGTRQEGTVEVMARSAVASPTEGDEATIGGALESDLPTITHADGMAILNEYFPKSAIDSRPLNGAVAPDELPTSIADTVCRDSPLVPLIQSNTPEALTVPPSASPNAVSSEASGILDPDLAMGGVEIFESTSGTGSPDSVSSCTDLTSSPSSETDDTDIDLPDVVTHTPFARRLVLDDAVQLLDHVLVALENVYDDRRRPNSSVLGVLDDILTTSDPTNFVKIMTSVTENWAKCNRLIGKPALEVAQERHREVKWNSLNRIKQDRCQMNMTREDRIESERLKHAIACLDVRELLRIELRDLLSEPAELMGEESDYENAMKQIEKENADDIRTRLRRLWKESTTGL